MKGLEGICGRSRLNLRKESFPNRAVNMWDFLPECVVDAPSVDSFRNRLDKQCSNEEIVNDYKAAAPAGRKIYARAGTQDLTIEAKACGHEDTRVVVKYWYLYLSTILSVLEYLIGENAKYLYLITSI